MFLQNIEKFTDLKDVLLHLSESNIQNMVDSSIFSRGKSYFRANNVFDIEERAENIVTAKVRGSYVNSYDVKLYVKGNSLRAECSCPYPDVCKHTIATLLSINKTQIIKESVVVSQKDKVLVYLETLSKSELISLVIEFSSERFKKEIILKDTPVEELNIHINEIATSIRSTLNDEELLYNPEVFQEKISEYMENLKIFVNKNPDEVFNIVFDLVNKIETNEDNGYLYIDHYYEEEYFDFDILSAEVMSLIDKISDNTKQVEIFIQFAELSSHSSHIEVNYDDFKVNDKTVLLEYFNKDSSLNLYYFIEELLTFQEKEQFLLDYNEQHYVYGDVVDLYCTNNKKELAIEYIEKLIDDDFNLDYVQKLLETTDISTQRLKEFIIQTIESNANGYLNFFIENIKKIDDQKELELLLKNKNLFYYYKYLDKEKRISEMFNLLNKLPNEKDKFFKRYKNHYKIEAIAYFQTQIEDNLKTTGDNFYHAIAEYLAHLKEIIDTDQFIIMVQTLKSNYKRRRNFVAILDKRFNS